MPEIKHPISRGDTLGKIARQYGIKNHQDLRSYHNKKVPLNDLMGPDSNFDKGGKLDYVLIPPQEEIDRMNADGEYVPTQEDTIEPETTTGEQNAPEQQEEEQQQNSSGQASEHDQKYVVIQKGQCVCDQSNPPNQVPVKMKVTSHTLQHANGDTADHLIATEEDTQFDKPAQPFGPQCLKQPNGSSYNPCSYSPAGKWQKTYEKMKVMDKAVVTELSELMCVMGGKITIFQHGQTQEVIAEHFENVSQEELLLISPLAEKPEPGKEIPKVKSIKGTPVESNKSTSSSTTKNEIKPNDKLENRGDGVNELTIRAGETVKFEVTGWWNAAKADKTLTNWEVLRTDGKSPDWNNSVYDLRESGGSNHEELFHVPGFYRVFAYGNAETKWDNRCAIDVKVIENKLDESKKGIKVTGGDVAENLIRRGAPTVFQPAFLMDPSAEEKEKVQMWATDDAGNQLEAPYSATTGLSVTPQNHGQKIIVHVSYTTLTGKEQSFSKEFKSVNNSVMEIKPVPESTVYRPGTTINFSATKMKFSTRVNEAIEREEWARIKWDVNGQTQPGKAGRSFSFTPTVKKKYTVEAWVSQANSSAKDELDDWRFEVTDNKPTGFKGGNTANWIVGKEYEITVETLMPDFDPVKDGKINWFTTPGLKLGIGQHDDLKTKVTALTKGSHILQAELGGKKITLTITAELAEIKRWCITDKDFDFKSDAGWGEELYALVETSPLLAGEKIHLHLLEFDSSSDANYIKDLGEVSFDAKGIAKVKFTTDGIKQELNKLWNERGNYEMFFAAEVKQGAVQFAEVTQKNRGGKTTVYPSKTVSHNGLEKGKFTYIDSKKDITSIRFLKSNGKDAYEIMKFGEPIKIKVQTRNLEGTELKLNIIWNKLGQGTETVPQNQTKKVENETAEWTVNTNSLKSKLSDAAQKRISLWNVEVIEADGDKFRYPKENARLKDGKLDWQKLITYQSLKLSDTNAMSEFAKTNAPLIIGEPLELENSSEKGDCFCNRDITIDEFKNIISKLRNQELAVLKEAGEHGVFGKDNCKLPQSDKTIEKLHSELIKVMNNYDINTCIRKIHFIAQVYWEADRFRTTREYGSSLSYDPFRGRGIMQLTHDSGYKAYGSYVKKDLFTDYEKVAENLFLAVDSAGWFWKKGKILSVGKTWTPNSKAPSYVKIKNPNYPKNSYEYTDNGKTVKYGAVDLNLVAEDDYVDVISYLVNGGGNGLNERRNYVTKLKTIFEYPQKCINKGGNKSNSNSETDNVTIRLVRKWQTNKSTIGEFTIDDTDIKGYILEEKGPDTTVSGIEQRVPIGTYNLEWHSGSKIKKGLKLFNDQVSKDRAILIHGGNTADDTEGCLLPGTTRDVDFVGSSQAKLKEIFEYVEEKGIEGAKIIITESYE